MRRGDAPGTSRPDLSLRLALGAFETHGSAQGRSVKTDFERVAIVWALPSAGRHSSADTETRQPIQFHAKERELRH